MNENGMNKEMKRDRLKIQRDERKVSERQEQKINKY